MRNYYVIRTRADVDDFVKKSKVAIGWSDIDFTKYIDDQDKLLEKIQNHYYSGDNVSHTVRGRKLGEIKRFINIQQGDIIVVPSYRSFYIGVSTGEFVYDETNYDKDLSNQLSVDFKKDENDEPIPFERNGKNTALVTKLKARGFTILDIKGKILTNYIDELLSSTNDISDVEKIIKFENQELKSFKNSLKDVLSDYKMISLRAGGIGFEELIKALMESDGYKATVLSKKIGGNGIADVDILAVKESQLADEFTTACYIQAKHYWGESRNGIDQIIDFKEQTNGDFETQDQKNISINPENIKYFLISSGSFCKEVSIKAEQNNIILIDGERLSEILFNKIDELPIIRYQLGFVKKFEHYTNK